jgi:hypothetical protein
MDELIQTIITLLTGFSAIVANVFPTFREYFLINSSEFSKELREMYFSSMLQILMILIFINILQIALLIYAFVKYRKNINILYFIIVCLISISSIYANIVSFKLQVEKYDLNTISAAFSLNTKAINTENNLFTFIKIIATGLLIIFIIIIIIVLLCIFSKDFVNTIDIYTKKEIFNKMYNNLDFKRKKINESIS